MNGSVNSVPVPSNKVVGYIWYGFVFPDDGDGNAFAVIVAVSSVEILTVMPAFFMI